MNETKWKKPQKVDGVDSMFGGNMSELMPEYADIPKEFKNMNSHYGKTDADKWINWQTDWFYKGLSKDQIPTAKDGIDLSEALGHLKAIQASWSPKHEHKMAGVAYLASLWFNQL